MKPSLQKLANALGFEKVFHLDFETYSDLDIGDGVRAYSTHPSTEVLFAAYAYDNDEPYLWDTENPGSYPNFQDIERACNDPSVLLIAWNAPFEREILLHVWGIDTPPERWLDAMVVAYSMSLPGNLAGASAVLQLDDKHAKDASGKKLIQIFCKPQPANQKLRRRDNSTNPEQWEQFGEYCRRDLIAERACLDRMSGFLPPPHEIRLWWLDQHINAHGMPIDLDLVDSAQVVAETVKSALKKEGAMLTGLTNPNSRDQFLPWVQSQGYASESLAKDKVDLAIRDGDLPEIAVKALKLRLQFSKNSTAKFKKISAQTVDGRLCYTLQFAAAGRTWRWGGRGAQYQNLPRPTKELESVEAMGLAINIIKRRDAGLLRELYDEPVNVLASAIRPTVRAPEGKIIRVADYNAVEHRGLGWLARCERIMRVHREGLDPYKDFGVDLYGVPYDEITKAQRTGAKPGVLGGGYRLGGGQLKVDEKTGETSKTGLWGYAESLGIDLSQQESKKAVEVFRAKHPEVVEFWYALEEIVRQTITERRRRVRKIAVGYSAHYLEFGFVKPAMFIRLPCGRCLWYVRPRVEMCSMPWKDEDTGKPARRMGITYWGLNQQTNQWRKQTTHGGKLTENIDQAICRDILGTGLWNAHDDGFTPVLHVHDEVVTVEDIDDTEHSVARLEEVLAITPDWCRDLLMKAEGYEAPFYMKD